MKNKHRIKQGLSLLLAGGIALTNLGAALPALRRMPRHAGDSFSGHT
ncbi:hypothetical protein NIA69_00070 [Gemmiger formicilis]|nr:hypothetical protein [Gemmiger formicilis]